MAEATHTIKCGHCHAHHLTVAAVRACCQGLSIEPCTWLVKTGTDEFGGDLIYDCGADSWADDEGWRCSRGHSHVPYQQRIEQGWDYASDGMEAELLRRNGTQAVHVSGGSV